MVHPTLCWYSGLSWAPLLSRLRLPGARVGVVPRLAAVIAGARECWRLLSGRRSCLPWSLRCWRSWGSGMSRRCQKPLALARLLLLSRRVLLRPLLVLLGRLEARTGVAARSNWSDLPPLI